MLLDARSFWARDFGCQNSLPAHRWAVLGQPATHNKQRWPIARPRVETSRARARAPRRGAPAARARATLGAAAARRSAASSAAKGARARPVCVSPGTTRASASSAPTTAGATICSATRRRSATVSCGVLDKCFAAVELSHFKYNFGDVSLLSRHAPGDDAALAAAETTYHVWMLVYLSRYANSFFKPISDKKITPRYVKMKILPLHFNIYAKNLTALLLHQATASRRTPRSSTRRSSTTAATSTAPSRSPGASRRNATTSAAATTATTTAATAATTAGATMIAIARPAASLAFCPSYFRRRRRALPPARPLRRPPRPGRLRPPRPRARRLRPPRRPPLDSGRTHPPLPFSRSLIPPPKTSRLRCGHTLLRSGKLPEALRESRSPRGRLLLALRGVEDGGRRATQEHAVPHALSQCRSAAPLLRV